MKAKRWLSGGIGALVIVLTSAHQARAEVEGVEDTLADRGPGDGVYGRFDGDLSLSAGLGAGYDGSPKDMRLGVSATALFYQSIGIYGSFWQSLPAESPVPRAVEVGVTLRPMFLLRWSNNREWGRPFWDLFLDSFGLSMGVILAEPRGADLGSQNGLSVALGAGIPLLRRAPGPWLRVRGGIHAAGPDVTGTALAVLEWQWFFFAGILD